MYLTGILSETLKWRIPDSTLIPPGGTLIIWADGEEDEGPLHTNFHCTPISRWTRAEGRSVSLTAMSLATQPSPC